MASSIQILKRLQEAEEKLRQEQAWAAHSAAPVALHVPPERKEGMTYLQFSSGQEEPTTKPRQPHPCPVEPKRMFPDDPLWDLSAVAGLPQQESSEPHPSMMQRAVCGSVRSIPFDEEVPSNRYCNRSENTYTYSVDTAEMHTSQHQPTAVVDSSSMENDPFKIRPYEDMFRTPTPGTTRSSPSSLTWSEPFHPADDDDLEQSYSRGFYDDIRRKEGVVGRCYDKCNRFTLLYMAILLLTASGIAFFVARHQSSEEDLQASAVGASQPSWIGMDHPTRAPAASFRYASPPPHNSDTDDSTSQEPATVPATSTTPITEAPTAAADSSSTASATTPTTDQALQQQPAVDVVIIGAGWAGLSAANYLVTNMADGINIVVLEARDYLGGRSRTVRNFVNTTNAQASWSSANEQQQVPIELGSEWTYGNTPLQTMVLDLGISYSVTNHAVESYAWYKSPTLHNGSLTAGSGTNSSMAALMTPDEKKALIDAVWTGGFVPFAQERAQTLWASSNDMDVAQVIDEYLVRREEANGQKTTSDQWDTQVEERLFLRAMVNKEIATEFAANLDALSAKETTGFFSGNKPEMNYLALPGGGYDTLISALAQPFLEKIQLKSRVTTVEYGQENEMARVTYVDASGTKRTVQSSAVLVTVPLGVLKASDIAFIPSLPQEKLDAIDALGFGSLNKCIMYWQDEVEAATWWPRKQSWMGLITDKDETSGAWTLFFNAMSQGNGGHNILVGFLAGDDADSMESQTDRQVLADVLTSLRKMLGAVPKPTKYLLTRWKQDEFSRGAYSFPSPGVEGSARFQRTLRRPLGNLFWAGEALDANWYGTTAGAYASGTKAGEKITLALSRRQTRD
jgi:monoamine oxidase